MPTVHDPSYRAALENRVRALGQDSPRQWGTMTIDQMLWHVNSAMQVALGQLNAPAEKTPLPRAILKFMVLNLPWMKGAPTSPAVLAKGKYDLETERQRCLNLVGQLASKSVDSAWADSPFLGPMSGQEVGRLQAKHLDHHLRQFSA